MNLFIFKIERNEITNLLQLKSCYRKAIKQIHPDISGKDSNEFLTIHNHFLEATEYLNNPTPPIETARKLSNEQLTQQIFDLFIDLMSSNFPQDRKICFKNKIYISRITKINELTNMLFKEQNIFDLFQEDLYVLRKDTVISNHSFNVTISYLNNIKDYILLKHKHGYKYIQNTYPLIFSIFKDQELLNGLLFINWLVSETIGKGIIRGDLPTNAST